MTDNTVPTLSSLLKTRLSRRHLLRGGVSLAALGLMSACQPARAPIPAARLRHAPAFDWAEVPHGSSDVAVVPEGWRLERLAASLPTTTGLTCLPPAKDETQEALLWLSHGEGLGQQDRRSNLWLKDATRADAVGRDALQRMVNKAQEETGGSVLALARQDGIWRTLNPHPLTRRITMHTPIELRGPAAGNYRLQTPADPKGTVVNGMLGAGAACCTPWGTLLVGEGDIHRHFRFPTDATEAARLPEGNNHVRMSLHDDGWHRWGELDARFDARRTPNEANRFGWVVEIDPHNPTRPPVKRTAMGRFRHGGIAQALCPDGRIAVYMSDGEVGEYLYRFVSEGKYQAGAAITEHLLDRGELSVAQFDPAGLLYWLPLRFGHGPLTESNGFSSQADVMIEARKAADLLKATPLDMPTGLARQHGRIYLALNGDAKRSAANAANMQAPNPYGHMLELIPPTRRGSFDHAAPSYDWSLFMQGGDLQEPEDQAFYLARMSDESWLANPAGLTADKSGNLWLATAGMEASKKQADKLYALATIGPWRGRPYAVLRAPAGCRIAGPAFMPDGGAMLVVFPERQEILTLSKANGEKILVKV